MKGLTTLARLCQRGSVNPVPSQIPTHGHPGHLAPQQQCNIVPRLPLLFIILTSARENQEQVSIIISHLFTLLTSITEPQSTNSPERVQTNWSFIAQCQIGPEHIRAPTLPSHTSTEGYTSFLHPAPALTKLRAWGRGKEAESLSSQIFPLLLWTQISEPAMPMQLNLPQICATCSWNCICFQLKTGSHPGKHKPLPGFLQIPPDPTSNLNLHLLSSAFMIKC